MIKVLIVTVSLLLIITGIVYSTTQLLPDELIEVVKKNSCSQIDDFYKRPGMVKPPYVYGYLQGDEENSAAFWCKKNENGKENFLLIFMVKDDARKLMKCPDKIEWTNYPGGLSIYNDPNTTLEYFVYINNPQKKPPKNAKLVGNAILSEYDGVSELFYCYEGEWLVRQRH